MQSGETLGTIGSMFVIVTIGGKQYNVSKGTRFSVEHIAGDVGQTLTFDHVLLVSDGKKIKIGTPTVKKTSVMTKIVAQTKGEKINVRRFKSKVRSRKSRGFRALLTELEVTDIAS